MRFSNPMTAALGCVDSETFSLKEVSATGTRYMGRVKAVSPSFQKKLRVELALKWLGK